MIAPGKQPPSPSEESRVALKNIMLFPNKIRGWHPVICTHSSRTFECDTQDTAYIVPRRVYIAVKK
jgi:hypothetical protein